MRWRLSRAMLLDGFGAAGHAELGADVLDVPAVFGEIARRAATSLFEQPRRARDRRYGEAAGILAAVEPLAEPVGNGRESGERGRLLQHPLREVGVEPDPLPVSGGEDEACPRSRY